VKAIRADGTEREHSQVCKITDRVGLSAWPAGSRLIARRTKLREGDQQSFADHDGYRLAVFLTDQQRDEVPKLDLTHRGHARVEGRIRQGKDCGLRNLPFQAFATTSVTLARDARPRPDPWTAQTMPRGRRARVGLHSSGCAAGCYTAWQDRPPRTSDDPLPRPRLAMVRPARRPVHTAPGAAAACLTATTGSHRQRSRPRQRQPARKPCPNRYPTVQAPHATIDTT
jgi:hypothetical protein